MPSSRPPMSKEHAPGVLPASSNARALKAAHGSSSSLCVENTSAPLRSNARANVGAPPRRKSAATVIVIAPAARSALLMLMARCCRNAETVLISRLRLLRRGASPPRSQAQPPWRLRRPRDRRDAAPVFTVDLGPGDHRGNAGDGVSRLLGVLWRFEVDRPDGCRARHRRTQIAEIDLQRMGVVGLRIAHDLVNNCLVVGL